MALRGQPYLPLYVQDFMTDEKLNECSAESVGVYIRIMCVMHKSEQYGTILLRQKDQQNASKIKNFAYKLLKQMPYEVDVIERSLQELIDEGVLTIDGDTLLQKRMVRDANISDTRAYAGSRGGVKTNDTYFAVAKVAANGAAKVAANTEYEIEDDIEDVIDTSNVPTIPKISIPKRFDILWNLYPRKQGRKTAFASYERDIRDGAKDEDIKRGIEAYIAYIKAEKISPQFIKHGSTFFNQRAWEDDYEYGKDIQGNAIQGNKPGQRVSQFAYLDTSI